MTYDPDIDPVAESGLIHIGFDEDGLPEFIGTPAQHVQYHKILEQLNTPQ